MTPPTLSGLEERVNANDRAITDNAQDNKEDHGELWKAIEKIRDRLPNWAVALISLLMAVIGKLL